MIYTNSVGNYQSELVVITPLKGIDFKRSQVVVLYILPCTVEPFKHCLLLCDVQISTGKWNQGITGSSGMATFSFINSKC